MGWKFDCDLTKISIKEDRLHEPRLKIGLIMEQLFRVLINPNLVIML